MAGRHVRERNIRAMVGVGLDPGYIAAWYGWTEAELWQWCQHHGVSLDREVPRGEDQVNTYYICTLCGAQSGQFPDQGSLREHRKSVHGEVEDVSHARYDVEQIRSMAAEGKTAQEICVAVGIDVVPLIQLCFRNKIKVRGLPGSKHGQKPIDLQAEVDALRTPTTPPAAEPVAAEVETSAAEQTTQPRVSEVAEAVEDAPQETPAPPASPTLRQVIERTRADVLQAEREIHAKRAALDAQQADLRVLEEAQRVMDRLAKGGAA